jgi:hypothetical protein
MEFHRVLVSDGVVSFMGSRFFSLSAKRQALSTFAALYVCRELSSPILRTEDAHSSQS